MAADGPLVVASGQIGTAANLLDRSSGRAGPTRDREAATTHVRVAVRCRCVATYAATPGAATNRDTASSCGRPATCRSACNRVMADEALSSTEPARVVSTRGVTGSPPQAMFGATQRRIGKFNVGARTGTGVTA
jgi:hypothetical protein